MSHLNSYLSGHLGYFFSSESYVAVEAVTPSTSQVDVSADTSIVLDIIDTGDEVDASTVEVRVSHVVVWEDAAPANGWGGAVSVQAGYLRYSLYPPVGFAYESTVTVEVSDAVDLVSGDYSFTVEANPACWSGTPTPFEDKLLTALPHYALEQLRTRFLFAVTTGRTPNRSARAALQLAFETELSASLTKVVRILPEVKRTLVCDRRRYLEIALDMAQYKFLLEPALVAASAAAFLPDSYLDLIRNHLNSPYPRYRVSAIAALLCFSAHYLVADTEEDIPYSWIGQTGGDWVGGWD